MDIRSPMEIRKPGRLVNSGLEATSNSGTNNLG